ALVDLADGPATIGFFQDITDRKRAEEELQKNLDALKQSETIANLGYFERNWQTGEGYWSDGFCRLLGRQPRRILSHDDFMAYIHDDDRDKVAAHIRTCLETGDPMNIEFRIIREDGRIRTIHGIADTTYDRDGEPLLTRGTFQDITNQKSLQEQLREAQKMEAVGTLAGGIAHDFNNLLHIISGHAELLETELAERNIRFGDTTSIRRSAERGAELVKQILTFSRRVDTRFELTDLNEDVRNAEKLLSRTIPKMIEIEQKLEEGLRPVRADSTQIEQTFINLAVNAKDAMREGGELTIETQNVSLDEQYCRSHEDLAPGHYVLLKVSDTGQGMNEDVLQHIFEPFFTTKELVDGTGLGLATVFGIPSISRQPRRPGRRSSKNSSQMR
ncbi:MAG: PAS domain-containing protein, partial [Deltaproteobacteria bacterium]